MEMMSDRYEAMGLRSGAQALHALDQLRTLAPLLVAMAKTASRQDREVLQLVAAIIQSGPETVNDRSNVAVDHGA